jgi:tRNA modification GTPase
MSTYALDDTIAAIATAPGAAGLAVVRVSGPRALACADRVFRGRVRLAEVASHTLHHGLAVAPGAAAEREAAAPGSRLDEVVAAVFRAPRSYTREDVVEFSCHGGRLPAARVLDALVAAGVRLAGPGEFTLRAFLSGRLDLAQAEAVADLIAAETEAARAAALDQLTGSLSRSLAAIEERLADVRAEIEARVDFAEDVGGVEIPDGAVAALSAAERELAALLRRSRGLAAVRAGVRVPIVGRPNVGKSSLFNALLGEERAIVTAVPGTTRDRVSEAIEVAGVRVVLSDTAGLRTPDDALEAIGVERARAALVESGLAIWVIDGSHPLVEEDRALVRSLAGRRVVVALNQRDRGAVVGAGQASALLADTEHRVVETVAVRGEGLDALRCALADLLGVGRGEGGLGAAASNPRHLEALAEAREALEAAAREAREGAPGEVVAAHVRDAIVALGGITGRAVSDDLLDRIFARFCIGK